MYSFRLKPFFFLNETNSYRKNCFERNLDDAKEVKLGKEYRVLRVVFLGKQTSPRLHRQNLIFASSNFQRKNIAQVVNR